MVATIMRSLAGAALPRLCARTPRQAALRTLITAAGNGGELPQLDWRAFRAKLAASESYVGMRHAETANRLLLRVQNPGLAAEPIWAHATAAPEAGGLLLAAPQAHKQLGSEMWQAVVLIVEHTPRGSLGLVLNRPTNKRLGLEAGRRCVLDGSLLPIQGLFDGPFNSRLYWGGDADGGEEGPIRLLHGEPRRRQQGSLELAPGIYLECQKADAAAAAAGGLSQGTLRFIAGCCAWGPGQLEEQLTAGAWQPAAASRSLVLKHAAQLPTPLWQELMAACIPEAACQLH